MTTKNDFFIASFLFVISTLLYCYLSNEFNSRLAFSERDILFDADAEPQLIRHFAHGWAATTPIHPWFRYYYSPFVRIAARIIRMVSPESQSIEKLRESLCLYCIPFTSGMTVAIFYFVLRFLAFCMSECLIVSCITALSFSMLIFGSLPDRFATSGFFLTLGLMLTPLTIKNKNLSWILWGLVGALSTGTTITQLVPITTLFFCNQYLQSKNRFRAIGNSLAFGVIVGAIVLASTLALHLASSKQNVTERTIVSHTVTFFSTSTLHKIEFLSAIPNAIAPPRFGVEEYLDSVTKCQKYKLTLETVHSPIRSTLLTLLCVSGCFPFFKSQRDELRILGLGSLLVVMGNLALHAFWGYEWVLFSLHWLTPSLVLLSGNLLYFRDNFRCRIFACVMCLLLVAINNYILLQGILDTLSKGVLCL